MNSLRLFSLKKEASDLYCHMTGNQKPIPVKISPFPDVIHTSLNQKTLFIHPLFLLTPEDFPLHLRPSGPNDQKLRSPSYFPALRSWLSREFHLRKSELIGLEKKLACHLYLWKRPALIDRIKRFAVAHEISHLALKHTQGTWDFYCAAAVSTLAAAILFAFFPPYIFVSLALLATYSAFRIFAALRAFFEQRDEIAADRLAVKTTGDLEGGKACLAALREYKEDRWNHLTFVQKMLLFLFRTEEILPISHPSLQSRITYLKEVL